MFDDAGRPTIDGAEQRFCHQRVRGAARGRLIGDHDKGLIFDQEGVVGVVAGLDDGDSFGSHAADQF